MRKIYRDANGRFTSRFTVKRLSLNKFQMFVFWIRSLIDRM